MPLQHQSGAKGLQVLAKQLKFEILFVKVSVMLTISSISVQIQSIVLAKLAILN